MKNLICTVSVVLFLILTLTAHPTLASTIHVPADQPTIQAGIDAAVDGDLVLVAPDTYVENIDFLGKAITLQSEAGAATTIIDGNETDTVVFFNNGETEASVIDGFTITNGMGIYYDLHHGLNLIKGGGVTCFFSASPIIRNCSIIRNITVDDRANAGGGGIKIHDPAGMSSPVVVNCIISDNISITPEDAHYDETKGGGICIIRAPAKVLNCTISGNICAHGTRDGDTTYGGGIALSSEATIVNCRIIGNSADRGGGISWSGSRSNPTIRNCTIMGNEALAVGGGIYCQRNALGEIVNCTISGNTNGGIYCWNRYNVTVKNCIVWNDSPSVHGSIDEITVTYSDVQSGFPGIGNIDSDPLFAGGGDYHLTEGSPCIDAGNPDPAYDDGGFPPSMGTERNDMGAYGGPGASGWICWDVDGDGHDDETCGGTDCFDYDPLAYPGAVELCDGKDTDCDGVLPDDEVDEDEDEWIQCKDCDDTDPEINPGLYETPGTGNCSDGKDNDCDGLVDTDPECGGILVPSIHHPTIQAGIDAAGMVGDRVIVAPGTYLENIDFLGKTIMLKSEAGADATVIDGDGIGPGVSFVSKESGKAILDGFWISRGSHGIHCEDSSPVITNCKITDSDSGIYCYGASPIITNCIVQSNSGSGIFSYRSSPTITNCVVSGNSRYLWGGGISCEYESNVTIANCTITGNVAGGAWPDPPSAGGGVSVFGGSFATITNSIIWGNSGDLLPEVAVWPWYQADITFSDVGGGWLGWGNINEDPLLDGYHLTPESPCINAGIAIWWIYKDIDGQRRPFGPGFDMGADEYSTEEPLPCSVIASSGNQFMAFYMIPVLALILLSRRFMRR